MPEENLPDVYGSTFVNHAGLEPITHQSHLLAVPHALASDGVTGLEHWGLERRTGLNLGYVCANHMDSHGAKHVAVRGQAWTLGMVCKSS